MFRQTQSTIPISPDEIEPSGGPGAVWEQYRHVIVPLGLAIITLVVFATALGNDFLVGWDDDFYLTQNPQVTSFSLGNLVDHWTKLYRWEYMPTTLTSYSIQNILFGDNPMPYRLVNILLHILNGILIYQCLSLLQPHQSVSIFAAVMFLIHPLQVESVVWIAQHKTVLAGFFFLTAFWLHLYASRKKGRRGALIASYVLFGLSLLAKPNAVLGGVVFLSVNFIWLRLSTTQIIVRNLPYLILGAVVAGIAILGRRENGGIPSLGTDGPLEQAQLILHSIWDYVAALLLPFNLNNLYIYNVDDLSLTDLRVWLGLLFILATVAIALVQPWGKKISLFAVVWFWALLLPMLNLIPNGYPRADRFLYLSGAMFFVIVALGLVKLTDMLKRQEVTYAVNIGMALICVIFGFLTLSRNEVWADTGSLMRDHLTDYPESITGLNKLATYELGQGDLAAAAAATQVLVRTYPTYTPGLELAALIVTQRGDYRQAVDLYARVLEQRPNDPLVQARLGTALVSFGLQAYDAGEYEAAIQLYVEALNYIPDAQSASIHNNIGYAYYTLGQNEQALVAFDQALQRNPNYATAWLNTGDAALNLANYELARNAYVRAVELEGSFNAQNASNFCLALGELRQDPEVAIRFCQIALDLEPDNGLYLGRSAHVLLIFGSNEEALRVAQRAVEVSPDLVLNWRVFGDALRLAGDVANARVAYQNALALNPNNQGALDGLALLDAAAPPPGQ